jgi:hypothetical protein
MDGTTAGATGAVATVPVEPELLGVPGTPLFVTWPQPARRHARRSTPATAATIPDR